MLRHNAPVVPKGKRTNSLAFCQTDCHTCASTGLVCDRRRPQCSTCLSQGRKCGGFATPLSWDDKRIWVNSACSTGSPARVQGNANQLLNDYNNEVSDTNLTTKPSLSRFQFVEGDPKRKRRKICPSQEQRVRDQATGEGPILLQDEVDNSTEINGDPELSNMDTVSQVPELGNAFSLSNQERIVPNQVWSRHRRNVPAG